MGMPDVPRWVGQRAMGIAVSVARQNSKDVAHIRSSGAIAILVSKANDKRRWIDAGRCYQRLALQATALNIRSAFINQPVEVAALRTQFANYLGIGNLRPDLIIRLGHGPAMPRSLRRPVQDVLV